jgi:uncharacterized protein
MDAIIAAGQLSKRQYSIVVEKDVFAPVSDGVNICMDVFRPHNEDKFPALLSIAPYGKDLQTARVWPRGMSTRMIRGCGDGSFEAGPMEFFVRRGYVHYR